MRQRPSRGRPAAASITPSTAGHHQRPSTLAPEQSQLGGADQQQPVRRRADRQPNLNSLIDALDNHGLITVLAEPNLTAVSGEPASFLAGGEFPVPVPAGTGLVGIDWKNFGVSLNFVATVTDGRPHQPARQARGERAVDHRRHHHRQHQRARADDAPRRDDGRAGERPEPSPSPDCCRTTSRRTSTSSPGSATCPCSASSSARRRSSATRPSS